MKTKSLKINAFLNLLRQICSVIFPLITYPYVSHVLGASNLGKISFVQSIGSYFLLIANLGINNYAIREGSALKNDKKKFESFVSQLFTINLLTTILAYILLIITYLFWQKLRSYKLLLILQSLTLIFTTIGVDWLFQIFEDYFYITMRSIVVQIISLICMFLFIHEKSDYVIYSAITIFSSVGANLINFFQARKYCKLRLTVHTYINKHIKPLLILFCNNIVTTIYVNSDVTMIGMMLSDSAVGIYTISVKIYTLIKNIVSAIIIVTLPRLSSIVNTSKKEYNELSNRILNLLLVVVLPILFGLITVSNNVILLLSSKEFISGSMTLKILCIALFFSTLASFFTTSVLLPNRRESGILVSTSISSIVNVILNLFFIPLFGINGAAITTMIAELIVAIIAGYLSLNYIKITINRKDFALILSGSFSILIIAYLINKLCLYFIYDLILKVSLSTILYFFILYFGKHSIIYPFCKRIISKIISKKN